MQQIEYLTEIGSTNTYVMSRCAQQPLPHLYTVCTFRQTAGRGQRGNGWESEPDKNISFTTVLDTAGLPPERLWRLSMLAALSVAKTLRHYGLEATIKWPNDIYVGDLKICGILIENVLQGGGIRCSVAGVGLNINQEVFLSKAPNPTSMRLLTGREYDLKEVLGKVLSEMEQLWPLVVADGAELEQQYMAILYRREGMWRWRERPDSAAPMMISRSTEDTFLACIKGIDEMGCLHLLDEAGHERTYSFKQVQYVIDLPTK